LYLTRHFSLFRFLYLHLVTKFLGGYDGCRLRYQR
jgi:hypothetical protein